MSDDIMVQVTSAQSTADDLRDWEGFYKKKNIPTVIEEVK